jgi:hypothetical protein
VVDRRGEPFEKPLELVEVGGIEGCGTLRADFLGRLVESVGITAGEDGVGTLGPDAAGCLEPNAGAAADHNDGLLYQFPLAPDGCWSG